ncbi:Transcriptional regulator, TetR family [plant metagenome]|uniref:Transcriptional regulator, TetR family n=2 Tax=root TaxID=1 RepID=A0A1C3K0V1_9BURK|nr:TetR/AcrR family transcriptional regulator [Orrella dioscoreae]SBT25140.1 Transcriptional regulator, TetR family [Orrella dioscoreae]SOE50761.1 Transcriptional regulator, TetR family [Orrella dioscoreae]
MVNNPPPDSRSRDADRSQQVILAAALQEFSEHGLGGARMERIAQRAALNKRLIYYYFQSKDDLFLAVLEEAYRSIRQAEQALRLGDMPAASAIRRLTEFTWEYYIAHPEFLTLLNSENLHQGKHLARSVHIRKMNSPLIESLGEILERGRREGVFRGGVDPLQLYVSIAGMAYFYLSNHYTLSSVFGLDLMTPKAHQERLSHICDVVLGYVLKN